MENLSKNTTPLVSSTSVVSTQMPMIKAAGGVPLSTAMKMIEDLGMHPYCNGKYRKHFAIYECPYCGKHFRTSLNLVQRNETKSCGCLKVIVGKKRLTTHGMSKTKIYTHWSALKQRCYDTNSEFYYAYGGRGIKVCDEWKNDFKAFYDWAVINGYNDKLYIDREKVDMDYSPENCRWVSSYVNGQNKQLIDKRNKSGYRGVCFRFNKWVSQIHSNGKQIHIGMFKTPEQAAQAYNDFVITHGTAHPLNIIK
jgi:hypothetical protein